MESYDIKEDRAEHAAIMLCIGLVSGFIAGIVVTLLVVWML